MMTLDLCASDTVVHVQRIAEDPTPEIPIAVRVVQLLPLSLEIPEGVRRNIPDHDAPRPVEFKLHPSCPPRFAYCTEPRTPVPFP